MYTQNVTYGALSNSSYFDFVHLVFWFFILSAFILSVWLLQSYFFFDNNRESAQPIRETRGFSRAQTGDAVTAVIPMTWSITMLLHASAHSSNFDENVDSTHFTLSVIAYQWGWNYYFSKDLLAYSKHGSADYDSLFKYNAYNQNKLNMPENLKFLEKNNQVREFKSAYNLDFLQDSVVFKTLTSSTPVHNNNLTWVEKLWEDRPFVTFKRKWYTPTTNILKGRNNYSWLYLTDKNNFFRLEHLTTLTDILPVRCSYYHRINSEALRVIMIKAIADLWQCYSFKGIKFFSDAVLIGNLELLSLEDGFIIEVSETRNAVNLIKKIAKMRVVPTLNVMAAYENRHALVGATFNKNRIFNIIDDNSYLNILDNKFIEKMDIMSTNWLYSGGSYSRSIISYVDRSVYSSNRLLASFLKRNKELLIHESKYSSKLNLRLPREILDLDYRFIGNKHSTEFTTTRGNYRANKSSANKYFGGLTHRLTITSGLILPTHTPIHIICGSKDVIHSWAIPGLMVKIDCIPGYNCHRRLFIKWSGLFWGQCMEVCGRYHHWMPILIKTTHYDSFILWINSLLND